ncbi:Tetratricopeptide repeat-containing protein [Persephonella hydrogeniphila]|uniref:Tetratricopeptide repeat-containing protein n=1 Tax=Persephonella hydrogeniphila TaxID=198703 RepID=A0A285NJ74_9AQUI|nr:tetratricopeptide repeat protein [Persephonella hydrogeniphila]SNZ09540.1 Tetratricopeptide repeat-containing protein [Persephonella hydrogeniphila]
MRVLFIFPFLISFLFIISCAEKTESDEKVMRKILNEQEWGRINRAKKAVKIYTKTADECYKEGDYNRAITFYNKALVKLKYLKKLDHPRAAYIYERLGDTYMKLGHKKAALESYRKAYDIYLKFYGENNKKAKEVLEKISGIGS